EVFVDKIKSYNSLLFQKNAFELGKYIADTSGITRDLQSKTEEIERFENLGELFNAMKDFTERVPEESIDMETGEDLSDYFPSLDRFLNEIALLTDADEDDKQDQNKVKLMTIHSAKGLEFPHVYIVGLEEKLFPSYMTQSTTELEEERRLFYVAITRAKHCLTISYAQSRFLFGSTNFCTPSRFLMEIDSQLIEEPLQNLTKTFYKESSHIALPKKILSKPLVQRKTSATPSVSKENLNLSAEIADINQLKVGLKIFHDKFGIGSIQEVLDEGVNSKAIIAFEQFGVKTMLLRFAKLKIIQ
ncbi:MAG: ATP-binding domain-containing protein, partial [Bacteroidales bacterium]|nr:ATP-binding domain-containing protein [Bacteroidales bacterium]